MRIRSLEIFELLVHRELITSTDVTIVRQLVHLPNLRHRCSVTLCAAVSNNNTVRLELVVVTPRDSRQLNEWVPYRRQATVVVKVILQSQKLQRFTRGRESFHKFNINQLFYYIRFNHGLL